MLTQYCHFSLLLQPHHALIDNRNMKIVFFHLLNLILVCFSHDLVLFLASSLFTPLVSHSICYALKSYRSKFSSMRFASINPCSPTFTVPFSFWFNYICRFKQWKIFQP